ncbi:uncharacterized protein LOC105213346 [Zeugodacus cucurbitae]|uniref:uncharacterized protein LOC105213346 n=1 Tax=Zeugodacus cucurbitae TaxID=28588 RepID=UPI0023D93BAD|nr:uncharacterized protein LOC105213346 [Zeugodacus cucurbitae]
MQSAAHTLTLAVALSSSFSLAIKAKASLREGFSRHIKQTPNISESQRLRKKDDHTMQGYRRTFTFVLPLLLLTAEVMCAGVRSTQPKANVASASDSENDGSYVPDSSGNYVADSAGLYVEDNAGAYHATGEEGRWLADDLGVYHDDLTWRYVADNSGAWAPDNSGSYDPALEIEGVYHPDQSGVYKADNTGAYSKEYEQLAGH